MEALLAWLAQNLAWDGLKKLLPKGKDDELKGLLVESLVEAKRRKEELDQDRIALAALIEQRDRAIALLLEAKRRIVELEAELSDLRKAR